MKRGDLAANGKAMRALRVLAEATEPFCEEDVWRKARRNGMDTAPWHGALRKLTTRGLAERHGKPGGYRYVITDAGREMLAP